MRYIVNADMHLKWEAKKEIEEGSGKIFHVHGLDESIQLKRLYYRKRYRDLM